MTFARIDAFCHRHVLCIAAVGVLFSAVCYSQTKSVALDCRSGHAKVSDAYRPADSSVVALRLNCSGSKVRVVHDGLMNSSFE